MPEVRQPHWLDPREVHIRTVEIRVGPGPGEYTVKIRINGDELISFVPSGSVNEQQQILRAVRIGELESDWLIDLPAETLTSGPRIRVPKDQEETLFTFA